MADEKDPHILGMEMLEHMRPLLETLEGFKRMCAEHGYSPQAQEEMAVAVFKHIMSTPAVPVKD